MTADEKWYVNPMTKFDPETVPTPWHDYLRSKGLSRDDNEKECGEELGRAIIRAMDWAVMNRNTLDEEDLKYVLYLIMMMGHPLWQHEAMDNFMLVVQAYKAKAA